MITSHFDQLRTILAGRAAEGLGERAAGKEHFGNVVRWWRHYDPDLVPLPEEAREALARLMAEPVATEGRR